MAQQINMPGRIIGVMVGCVSNSTVLIANRLERFLDSVNQVDKEIVVTGVVDHPVELSANVESVDSRNRG